MKVLVTGGAGFLGSHVCELFKLEGWDVVSYDSLTKFEYGRAFKNVEQIRDYNLYYLEELGIPTLIADIRDTDFLKKAMYHCDLVVHCAAQPAMTIAIEDPIMDFETNVRGLLNVLEAARYWNTAVASCSTIHVYGNAFNKHLQEQETRFIMPAPFDKGVTETSAGLYGTISPLHASKITAETYVRAYIDTYNLRAANFRLTGIYGPRQFGGEDHGWVANFTIRTLLDQPIKIFGTDKQVRDILYVRDAANAFLKWFTAGCPSGTYNIGGGTDTTISIQELLRLLEIHTKKTSSIERLPKRHGDLWWFISNYTKAEETFQWKPTTSPSDGLQQLISWVEKERSLFE